ncbi:MAG: IS66 family insertion sequence element accessory protein TnpB [Proteobacteria bacterium]|nr:IS66 family insertion sequence element accessory protein TnpB [Pseudomonadota bacterium]MDA1326071.1 IS66 family insertion sequence element accessory protein TnpB [Pseudomonadota bacterium]
MMLVPAGVKVHIALGITDIRKGLDGLALLVQEVLRQDPFSGHLSAFRGRKAGLIKIMFWDHTVATAGVPVWRELDPSRTRARHIPRYPAGMVKQHQSRQWLRGPLQD